MTASLRPTLDNGTACLSGWTLEESGSRWTFTMLFGGIAVHVPAWGVPKEIKRAFAAERKRLAVGDRAGERRMREPSPGDESFVESFNEKQRSER